MSTAAIAFYAVVALVMLVALPVAFFLGKSDRSSVTLAVISGVLVAWCLAHPLGHPF